MAKREPIHTDIHNPTQFVGMIDDKSAALEPEPLVFPSLGKLDDLRQYPSPNLRILLRACHRYPGGQHQFFADKIPTQDQ